ncbi:MAG: SPOR domain-containing protein [Oscillospiraceae bacterium]|nr:SPOR domain-containing protein [Oscillospiraceae bacterium]
MRHSIRSILAFLLVLVTIGTIPMLSAIADNYRYPADQYFAEDTSLTKGYAVQISASKDYASAVKRRNSMLERGYDGYIYYVNGVYRTMCGKFRSTEEANHYRDYICSHTDRSDAYLTNVYLPEWAYNQFQNIYMTDPYNTQGQPYTSWEKPTGAYYDANNAASTKQVYTVQISAGTNFDRQEQHRDSLNALGFDAFVYKKNGTYRTMSGMFERKADAEARCAAIKTYTNENDAYVTQVGIPTSYVSYQVQQDQSQNYSVYANLLYNYNWARYYLPKEESDFLVRNKGQELEYVYFVCDIDGNGVDEIMILDVIAMYEGTWALFSTNRNGAYLIAWGATYSLPMISVCQEKGILAIQSYYQGYASCDLLYISNGTLWDSKSGYATGEYAEVQPWDVDWNAYSYFMVLQGFEAYDTGRLTGYQQTRPSQSTQTVVIPSTTSTPSYSSGYTQAGVMQKAKEVAQYNTHYSTVSDTGTELVVPPDSQFLRTPFQMRAYASANGKAIYIMPKPQPGNGNLGKVTHLETVTILAENDYYYFFVTSDGRAGWNGKSYFISP